MLAARGKPVLYLKRLSMGRLRLDPALAPGAWRMLTEEERSALNLSLSETLLDRNHKKRRKNFVEKIKKCLHFRDYDDIMRRTSRQFAQNPLWLK